MGISFVTGSILETEPASLPLELLEHMCEPVKMLVQGFPKQGLGMPWDPCVYIFWRTAALSGVWFANIFSECYCSLHRVFIRAKDFHFDPHYPLSYLDHVLTSNLGIFHLAHHARYSSRHFPEGFIGLYCVLDLGPFPVNLVCQV